MSNSGVPLHTELDPLWSVPPMVMGRDVTAVSKAKITRKLHKVDLETPQEGNNFEVSNNLPAPLVTFQGIKQDLDTAVFPFELYRVSQRKRWIHDEESPLAEVTGDSSCIEQTGHIVA